MKEVRIRQGERVRIVQKRSSSLSQSIEFEVLSDDAATSPGGTVEVDKSGWLLRKKPVAHPLQRHNSFKKGWLDNHYALYVTPDSDVTIRLTRGQDRINLVIVFVLLIALAVTSVIFMAILRTLG